VSSFYFIDSYVCQKCGKPTSIEVDECRQCRDKPIYFSAARSTAIYEGNLREAIHKFKYDNGKPLGDIFAKLSHRVLKKEKDFFDIDMVTYVPLGRKKELERGYNQSKLIAESVSSLISKPCFSILIRIRETEDQSKLDMDKRHTNIKNVFLVSKKVNIKKKRILLVDDVYTTGATVNECSKMLKSAGAEDVRVLTVARTEIDA
jgi:ComF family protein